MLYTVGGDEGDWSSCHILISNHEVEKYKYNNFCIYYNIGNIYSWLL